MIKITANKAINNFLAKLRDKNTTPEEFRYYLDIIAMGLAFEVSESINTVNTSIDTPLGTASANIYDDEIILMPILRAGLGLLPAFTKIFPQARIEYQALHRDEDNFSINGLYTSYEKINPAAKVIILEPMIATGSTLCTAVDSLKINGAEEIIVASILAAPEGLEKILTQFADINIYTIALDKGLNHKNYIIPGLGDAGDRINGN